MAIYKGIIFDNIIRPIQFTKPIKDNDGNIVKNSLISDDGKIYDKDEYESHDYFGYIDETSYGKYITEDNRIYVKGYNVEYENKLCLRSPLPRIMLIAFDEEEHDKLTYYKNLEANHINPSKPLSNNLENLEFVSHDENMRKAGETGAMIKKYNKALVHNICQDIADKVPRQEIMKKYNINYQLIDDIHAGRSHKSVSEQYVDKGFVYNPGNKIESQYKAKKVCELLEKGYKNVDILRELKNLNINYCFISDIKFHRSHNDISKDYNF